MSSLYSTIILTVVQYSCIGWVILWFLYRPPFPAKKQSWHISKLKHLRQRYLKCVNWHLEDFYINIYSIPESKNRILLANITFCLMLCSLGSGESTTRFHQQKSLRCFFFHKTYLWSTGSQTILWGSCFIQLKKWRAWRKIY